MTMQSYDLTLTGQKSTIEFNAAAEGFWYESETGGIAADKRIIVKPDNGNEIILKPGQSFRLPEMVHVWYVRSLDGTSSITGKIIIGSGDFADTNVKLDGSVAIAGTPTVNLSVGTKVQEEILAYTHSYTGVAAPVALTPVEVISPATNTNGLIIQSAEIEGSGACRSSFLAKATPPTDIMDGDLLMTAPQLAGRYVMTNRIRVPAGKGVYWISNAATSVMRGITLTKL